MLWIQNDDPDRLRIFRVMDPDPDADPDPEKDPTDNIKANLDIILKKTLKCNQKEEFTNDLPFSISYYSPTVHTVQNSQANHLSLYIQVPNPNSARNSHQKVITFPGELYLYCYTILNVF